MLFQEKNITEKKYHRLAIYTTSMIFIILNATYKKSQSCFQNQTFHSPHFIDVGLLGKTHHNIILITCEGLLLNDGVVVFCGTLLILPR